MAFLKKKCNFPGSEAENVPKLGKFRKIYLSVCKIVPDSFTLHILMKITLLRR